MAITISVQKMTENLESIDFSIKPQLSAYNDKYFSSLISTQLSDASNSEEFYSKLVELKNEQKKTLLFMQELYNQKKILKDEIVKSEISLKDLSTNGYTPDIKKTDENYNYTLNTVSAYETRPYTQTAFASKPPPGPKSMVTFQQQQQQTSSGDMMINDDLKRIEKIWNDFSLNDNQSLKSVEFNKRFEKVNKHQVVRKSLSRPSSAAGSLMQSSNEWIPKVTIPEPFSMSIREKVKSDQKKFNLARELQEERDKRIEAEIRECKNKFKANPIPAHVHMPLYEQQQESQKLRKQKLKQSSKKYLENNSRPFNLTETSKTSRERRHSFTEGGGGSEFSAKPLPDFYYEDDQLASQKLQESELYKQIKNQMRALELLRQSKLPHNMELQNEKKILEDEKQQFFINEMNKLQRQMAKKRIVQIAIFS